jgi:hypothetical protein
LSFSTIDLSTQTFTYSVVEGFSTLTTFYYSTLFPYPTLDNFSISLPFTDDMRFVEMMWSSLMTIEVGVDYTSFEVKQNPLQQYKATDGGSFGIYSYSGSAGTVDGGFFSTPSTDAYGGDIYSRTSELDANIRLHSAYQWIGETYHTGTYQCQMVPSDFGALSDGAGFIGFTDTPLDSELISLSNGAILSQVKTEAAPLIEFFWVMRTTQVLDFSEVVYAPIFAGQTLVTFFMVDLYEPGVLDTHQTSSAAVHLQIDLGPELSWDDLSWDDELTWDDLSTWDAANVGSNIRSGSPQVVQTYHSE